MEKFHRYKYLLCALPGVIAILYTHLIDTGYEVIDPRMYSVLYISFLVFLTIHFASYAKKKSIANIELLFSRILTVGITALVINVGHELLRNIYVYATGSIHPTLSVLFDLSGFFASLWFFLYTAVLFKKLVFVKPQKRTIRQWQWFISILIISSTGLYQFTHFPWYIYLVLLIIGLVVVLSLLFRIKWIALVNNKTQYFAIFYLVSIIIIATGLVQELFCEDFPYLIYIGPLHNVFYILLASFVIGYAVFALLALLFNLPLASIANDRLTEINSFQQLSRGILRHQPLNKTMELLFKNCVINSDADAGWLWLAKDGDGEPIVIHTQGIDQKMIELLDHKIQFTNWLNENKRSKVLSIPNLIKSGLTAGEKIPYNSLVALPIRFKNQLLGCIYLMRELGGGFDEHSLDMLKSFTTQAKISFENAHLIQSAVKNAKASQELAVARRVQKSLMPQRFDGGQQFDIAAINHTSKEVGGDYYDFAFLNNGRLAAIIADVSGTGTSAAFHMAELKGIFRFIIQLELPLTELINKANLAISDCLPRSFFITATWLILHPKGQKFIYGRCGHTPILIYKKQSHTAYYLADKGMGLGIIRNDTFSNYIHINEVLLDPEDVLVLFTDGLSDGFSNTNELFGFDRIRDTLIDNAHHSAIHIKDQLINAYKQFIDIKTEQDDHTVLVIKVNNQH